MGNDDDVGSVISDDTGSDGMSDGEGADGDDDDEEDEEDLAVAYEGVSLDDDEFEDDVSVAERSVPHAGGNSGTVHHHHHAPTDDFLEISVESLVGTVFEMRLSKRETIGNIKLRLQRLEGIPRQHMHLLYRGSELPDGASLAQCGVEAGATLRLILALRGGPINTRRVPVPNSGSSTANNNQQQQQQRDNNNGSAASSGLRNIPDEVKELMGKNFGKVPKNGQLTVLLFRDGAQLNLFHVVEKPDGTYSPLLNDSWGSSVSGDGMRNLFGADGMAAVDGEEDPEMEARLKENAVTMTKMSDLKAKMQDMSLAKKQKKNRQHRGGGVSSAGRRQKGQHVSHAGARNKKNARSIATPTTGAASSSNASTPFRQAPPTTKKNNGHPMPPPPPPLPPIASRDYSNDHDADVDDDDVFAAAHTSIMPLPPGTGLRRGSSQQTFFSRHSGSLNNSLASNSGGHHLPDVTRVPRAPAVPDWLRKTSGFTSNSVQNGVQRRKQKPRKLRRRTSQNSDFSAYSEDPHGGTGGLLSASDDETSRRGEAEDEEVAVVDLGLRHNRTINRLHGLPQQHPPRLISTDVGNLSEVGTAGRTIRGSRTAQSIRGGARKKKKRAGEAIAVIDSNGNTTPRASISSAELQRLGRAAVSPSMMDRENRSPQVMSVRGKAPDSGRKKSSANGGRRSSARLVTTPNKTSASGALSAKRKRTPRPRCGHGECRKKLNITNGFPCRCQKVFCAKHRHPELHACTFDYKEEGRRLLEKANPVVTFPKLPKI